MKPASAICSCIRALRLPAFLSCVTMLLSHLIHKNKSTMIRLMLSSQLPWRNTRITMLCLFLLCLLRIQTAMAATIPVSSLSALQTAINNAAPGDVIVLNNGSYTASSDITISKQGTATQPITITCQSIGGATISGTAGFSLVSPARYIIIRGFRFTHNVSQATMASGTSFCRWTRNVFETPGEGENLSVNGNDHEIDYNTFQHKNALGRFITIRGTGSQIAQRIRIHHNYFLDHNAQTGNGAESVQFGLSGYSLSNTNSIMEYNLFEECEGENEMVSLKVSQVTFRYNTIRNCPAHVTLRHGNRNTVYGNYFINTPGLRYFGDDHKIFSNHFENCDPAINIGNGGGEVADGDPLTSHDRPDRVLVAYNTLVNNPRNIIMQGRTNGLGAIDNTIANNIIQGGGAAVSLSGSFAGGSYSGNILFNTSSAGNMPSSGYQTVNPLLARDATGTFHLQTGSPAINAATGSYSGIVADMDGQPRPSPLDAGADEVSTAPVIARILTPSMVGPNAGSDPTPTCEPASASADDGNVPANVLDNDLNTRWSGNGDGQWIQFCLDDTLSVTGVQIAFYSGNTRTSSFDVLVGNDGVSWTTAAVGRVSSGTSLNPETFTFTAVSGKYVRIVGHGNSVNAWNSYTEVKIQTGSGGGQTFTLTPAEDAYVRDGTNAAITHGTTDPTLLITKVSSAGQLNNAREAYLLFDAASVTGTVTSATLRVYGKIDGTAVPSVSIGVFPVANTTWSESTLTWNNKPASGSSALATNTVTSAAYAYITWDVTSYVQAELAASRTTISFVMKSGAAHDPRVFWNASEFGSNAPQLVINTSSSSAKNTTESNFAKDQPASRFAFAAFPNPFSVSNTIQFHLGKAGHTRLAVFDISGKQVAILVNGPLAAGNHRVQFTPKPSASGIYLLKLVHDGKTEIRRIVKE